MRRPLGIKLDDGSEATLWLVPERNVTQVREATAWLELPLGMTKRGGEWIAAFRLVPDPGGMPVVAEVRVFPDHKRRSPGEWAPEDLSNVAAPATSSLVPAAGMPAKLLDRIRWSAVQAAAVRIIRDQDEAWRKAAGFASPALEAQGFKPTDGPRRGRPRDYVTLARTAVDYEDAIRSGTRSVVEAVAERMGCGYETANRRIREARKVGLLSPAPGKGKQGGVASAEAHKLTRKGDR
jgi:hypothetical protein